MKEKYKEALEYLYSQLPMFSRTGAPAYKPGLDTSIELSRYFGDPHKKFKSIHVGGTNGKGSTSHLLASVLREQGYKVGLYTSPHLVDFRERMRINGAMISEEKVVEFVERWKTSGYKGHPSFFELTMIMAFEWFAKEAVDYAVIEVGMGGRLDSTNIITPLLSVITNISYDHNQFLGETLPEIASEKAGIIKPGIPVVVGESQPLTDPVFISKAKETGSPIFIADEEQKDVKISEREDGWEIETGEIRCIFPLKGDYQRKNIRTVLSALKHLEAVGMPIESAAKKEGIEKVIENTHLAGRWMIMGEQPLVIADTGHNIAGLTYNFHQLEKMMKLHHRGKLRIVIGFVADKAIDKIMNILPKDALYYVTNAHIPRAMSADVLMEKFVQCRLSGRQFSDVKEAAEAAVNDAGVEDIIFIGGSTFIVADYLANVKS